MKNIRVVIADDHQIVRQGLVSILAQCQQCELVAEASDGPAALEAALHHRPDVVVLDISMPVLNGLEVAQRIHQQLPATKILVLTMHEEQEYVVHMVRAGVSGYLLKDSASIELLEAIQTLASGKPYFGSHASKVLAEHVRSPMAAPLDLYATLTKRERQVFQLVVEGKPTKEIARELAISHKTAENHRGKVLAKLHVKNAVELVKFAAKHGLLSV